MKIIIVAAVKPDVLCNTTENQSKLMNCTKLIEMCCCYFHIDIFLDVVL